MNPNFKKPVKVLAISVFFLALFLNIRVSLQNPFIRMDNAALAQTSSSSSSGNPIATEDVCKRDPSTMCTYNTTDARGIPIIATAPGWTKK